MTAAVLTSLGSSPASSCFSIDTRYSRPSLPSPDWILVRVKAAGLNRAELRSRAGDTPGKPEFNIWQAHYHTSPPAILGEEFVGLVEKAGSDTKFKKGQKVTGFVYGGGKAYDGAYAQYVLCHRRRLYRLPETSLSWDILGAIPMSMWTAYGSIFEAGQLQKGQSLLVHGGTSSVGIWAIILAKDRGCTVIATTRSEKKAEKLKTSGADHVLLESELGDGVAKLFPKGVDVILELVGPDQVMSFTLPSLARHGSAVVTGVLTKGWALKDFLPAMIPPTRKLTFYSMTNSGCLGPEDEGLETVEPVLAEVVRKVEGKQFDPNVFLDKVFRLEDVGKAHQYMEDNMAVGKVVLEVP